MLFLMCSEKSPEDLHAKLTLLAWRTKSSVLVTDEKGRMFQVFRVNKPEYKLRSRISPLVCWRRERLCGKKLRRPHLTCFYCRLRRVVGGELLWVVPVYVNLTLVSVKRGSVKKAAGKVLATLGESFSQ